MCCTAGPNLFQQVSEAIMKIPVSFPEDQIPKMQPLLGNVNAADLVLQDHKTIAPARSLLFLGFVQENYNPDTQVYEGHLLFDDKKANVVNKQEADFSWIQEMIEHGSQVQRDAGIEHADRESGGDLLGGDEH